MKIRVGSARSAFRTSGEKIRLGISLELSDTR